jgi:rhodanese-related sulfurtransferase
MSDSAVKKLSPLDAWRLLQENPRAVLIDVRSTMEYLFVGHPKGAVHVPWIDEPGWKPNPNFVTEVRKLMLGGAMAEGEAVAPVLLICRSGVRSLAAGEALIRDGFHDVYNIVEGFEGPLDAEHHRSTVAGWRFHGLPWEQS